MHWRGQKPLTVKGFTLLELIVVLAGLGILSSLAIPNFIRLLDFNNIDEAKALLNTAAADCLQKSRINDAGTKDTIDDEILSDKRLNTIGYKIDRDADKCSYLQLLPINEEDNIRYPIGFSVAEGKLSKFANPTSTDQASISSCENWAGINCKQDESLKELIAWKQSIAAAEKTCEDDYANWLKNGTSPYKSNRWNPNADSGCPSRPPKDGSTTYQTSNTCTPSGCNRTVYGLDGEFVGFTKESYNKKLEEKYGKQCTEWAAQKAEEKYTNSPIDQPIKKSPECGEQEFWFFEGENTGSKEGIQTALDKIASDKCATDREQARKDGFEGKWGPKEGPGECGEEKFICDKTYFQESDFYIQSSCAPNPPPQCKNTYYRTTEEACENWELNSYYTRACPPRPSGCGYVGRGAPFHNAKWDKSESCKSWAICMKLDQ